MLVPGELGFPGLVFVVCFLFGPILTFVARWKWTKAVARKKEILRLMAMASEEAARVELEASAELGAVYVARQSQCVLCYCPTTTRCSRCKAVHYCSGKCQIIHWRRGHKDECHPPKLIGQEISCNQKTASREEKRELNSFISETDEKLYMKPIKTFNEEQELKSSESCCSPEILSVKDDDKIRNVADTKGEGIVLDSPSATPLTKIFTSVTTNELEVGIVFEANADKIKKSKSYNVATEQCKTKADVNQLEQTKPPLGFIHSDASIDSSCLSNMKNTTTSSDGALPCGSAAISSGSRINATFESKFSQPSIDNSDFWGATLNSNGSGDYIDDNSTLSSLSERGDDVSGESRSALYNSLDLSHHVVPNSHHQHLDPKNSVSGILSPRISEEKLTPSSAFLSNKMVTNAVDKNLSTLKPEASTSTSNCSNSSHSQKPTKMGSRSCGACDDSKFSSNGVQSVLTTKPSVVKGAHNVHSATSAIASSVPNGSTGLRTSVRKAVQQFKAYRHSKHYPPGFGIENAEKYSHKMLFPYELFIKLYHWNKVELRPCGLMNCGNSCYANVVLQCLAFTRPLTAYLLQGLHSKSCLKNEWCFTCEFESLVLKAKDEKFPLSPAAILSNLERIGSNLGRGREEDAHEFLRYAIDTMQSVCLKEAGKSALGTCNEETTLMGLIFGGYLHSKIKCMKCNGKSERHERMMDLTVEIQGDIATLEEALRQFTATEILDGENKYYCCRCKSYEKAKKKLSVLEAPNILTIALKRFQTGKFGKLNKSVHFPEILNLAPCISGTNDKSPIYRLYAVVVHLDVMNAAFSGHYVCYVRNIQGKWFKIDDSVVKPVELENVLSKGAYMLFYSRFSPRAPSSIRNSILCNDIKSKGSRRCVEAGHYEKNTIPRTRSSIKAPKDGNFSGGHGRPEDLSQWRSFDASDSFESLDSFERMFHSMHRIRKVDSSSDNSSLFSCSDEGSCSTESTRDSSSTDDLSDYIFGEGGRSLNSPSRDYDALSSPLSTRPYHLASAEMHPPDSPETSDCTSCRAGVAIEGNGVWTGKFQESSQRESLQEKGSVPISYSDTYKHCRKLRNCSNCSSRKTDIQRLEQNSRPLDMKTGVHLRRSTKDCTAEPFY